MRLTDLRGRRVAVWGTGREGAAAVRAIAPVAPAALVVVQDRETFGAQQWTGQLAALAPLQAGESARAALADADVVVRSPGVAQTHPWIQEVRARGGIVTGGTALWMADHGPRTVGVTGSKGKSTTTSLISHLLTAVGLPNTIGGNIGIPVLDLPESDRYVLELSAYQCADLTDSPRVAVLTSLFPEHLDWSGGEEEYYRDKLTIVAHAPQRVVYPADDHRLADRLAGRDLPLAPAGRPDSARIAPGPDGRRWLAIADRPLFPRAELSLPGRHNEANLCLALEVLRSLGVDCVEQRETIRDALARFAPLPHRLSPIEDGSGITFVDDSLSTIPQSAIHAIEVYADRPLTVILGGEDRGVDYSPLRDYLEREKVAATVIGIPDSGARILEALAGLPHLTPLLADDLVDAVRQARAHTPSGGVVLLSPAAPSYGRFDNYEHRSRVFREAIAHTAGQAVAARKSP